MDKPSFSKKDYVAQILFPIHGLYHIKPSLSNLYIWCYNKDMSPRHFANYAKQYPKQYQAFSDNMWNGFVSITHTIGLSRFFSFTPEFLAPPLTKASGVFAEADLEALDPTKIGRELGKVYNQTLPDNKPL